MCIARRGQRLIDCGLGVCIMYKGALTRQTSSHQGASTVSHARCWRNRLTSLSTNAHQTRLAKHTNQPSSQPASQAGCYKQEGGVAVRRDWYGSQLYLLIALSLHKSLLVLAGKALEHDTCSTCSRYELLLTALCVCCWFSIYSLLFPSLCVYSLHHPSSPFVSHLTLQK